MPDTTTQETKLLIDEPGDFEFHNEAASLDRTAASEDALVTGDSTIEYDDLVRRYMVALSLGVMLSE